MTALPTFRPKRLVVDEAGLFHLGESTTRPPFSVDRSRPMFGPPPDVELRPLTFSDRPEFHSCHPEAMLYAVLDSAQDLDWAFNSHLAGYDLVSLFLGEQSRELVDAAPYFFAVREGSQLLDRWQQATPSNLGILIDSPAPPSAVFRHLREIFVVRKADGQEYFFRYYDPRVLRTYLPTCNRDELAEFFGPLTGLIAELESGDGFELFRRDDRGNLERLPLGSMEFEEPSPEGSG